MKVPFLSDFLAPYFSVPKSRDLHKTNVVKILHNTGHWLIITGALTSVPALISIFYGLIYTITGIEWLAISLGCLFSAFILLIVDFLLAALSPYLFDQIGLLIHKDSSQTKGTKIALPILLIICAILGSISTNLSLTGNKAIVEMYFGESNEAYSNEMIKLDSATLATVKGIESRYLPRVKEQEKKDADGLKQLKEEHRKKILSAYNKGLAIYKDPKMYATKLAAYTQQPKLDSAKAVNAYQPQAAFEKSRMDREVEEAKINARNAKDAKTEENNKLLARQEAVKNATYFLTGQIGAYSTWLGLLLGMVATLLTFKPAKEKKDPTAQLRPKHAITSNIGTYFGNARTQYANSGMVSQTIKDKLIEFIEELEEQGYDADVEKYRQQFKNEFGEDL